MASTPFRVVNWSPNELVGEDKMDTTNANMIWLKDNTPRAYYTLPGGIRRVEGVRLAAGRVLIPAKKSPSTYVTVNFSNLFSKGCQPIVTTGIVSTSQVKIFCVVNGIGSFSPDSRGFQTAVSVDYASKKKNIIARSFYVTWQAVGY